MCILNESKSMFETMPTPSSSQQALTEILDAVGWEGRASDTPAFTGADPQLPTTFRKSVV